MALSVCTSWSSSCCCSTHGSLAIAPVGALAAERRELERHVAELDLGAGGELGTPHLGGVDVDAVHAARVLDEEVAVLVVDAGVELGDRGLVERDVVVARATDLVGAGLQEADLLGQLAADHLEHGDGERVGALRAARRVDGVLGGALRAQHERP